MSGIDLSMGLRDRLFGPSTGPVGLDDAMLLRLERAVRRVQPDPLFERRLRGHLVNRYVATREGLLAEPRPRRQMGRLGRSVLYASLVLALSVSAAGAAAQESIPGDPLYGVKLRLEETRMKLAPASARGQLAEMALAERAEELERLAAIGAWHLVPAATARLTEARHGLIELDPTARSRADSGQLGAVDVLELVLADAPVSARGGLERALQALQQSPTSKGSNRSGGPEQSSRGPDKVAPGAAAGRDPHADDRNVVPEKADAGSRGRNQPQPREDHAAGKGQGGAPDRGGQGSQGETRGNAGQGGQGGGPPTSAPD
jgi:hypothetical protein